MDNLQPLEKWEARALREGESPVTHGHPIPVGAILANMPPTIDRAISLDNLAWMGGVILTTFVSDANGHELHGSAVMVAPGVALAARHVVELGAQRAKVDLSVYIGAFGVSSTGLELWKAMKVTLIEGSDIVILGMALSSKVPDNWNFRVASITTRTPRIGERLSIAGNRVENPHYPKTHDFQYRSELLLCQGNVTAVYPSGRDSVVMPFPCVEIDCPAWGGMSGGPVFDLEGHLIGVLSSSISGTDPMSGPAYVALLWPALATPFEGGLPPEVLDGSQSLLDFSRCHSYIDKPHAITRTGPGTLTYEAW